MRMQGSVETPWFDSAVLKGNLPGDPTERMIPVYLPPGYADLGQAVSGGLRACGAWQLRGHLPQRAGLGGELSREDGPADR